MRKSMRANCLLVLTALIWGVAFVSQDIASDSLEPFAFNAIRTALAALALLAVIFAKDRKSARAGEPVGFRHMPHEQRRTLIWGGLWCGLLLTVSSSLQQIGIAMGSGAGKAGFITALYIVLVPLTGLLFGKRVRPLIWLAVALATAGLYLLCVRDGLNIELSDVYLILCALGFTGHILVIDHFSPKADCVRMSCIQFSVMSVLCVVVSALFEHPTPENVRACWLPILYSGVMSGAVGYTLQMIAQKDTSPTVASLLMSLESVFAVLAGWVILGDTMSVREYLGCAAMMCGILLAQTRETHRPLHKTSSAV